MSDICKTTIIIQKEYLLFESSKTGMFYWVMFSIEFVFLDPSSKIFQVYKSQHFKTEEMASDARKNRALRLTPQ